MEREVGLIELCAGTAAVTMAAIGAPSFPVSRIGSKAGYTDAILRELGIVPGSVQWAQVVELDKRIVDITKALFSAYEGEMLAKEIESTLREDARFVWERARIGTHAADALLWMAGARGGIGGFKGKHVRRESVDGFIPSRESLVRRVRAFKPFANKVGVFLADAGKMDPSFFPKTKVYIDPPYVGRQGYSVKMNESVESLARRWVGAGHYVVVSEAHPLEGATRTVDISEERRGQVRLTLTITTSEWLSVFEP